MEEKYQNLFDFIVSMYTSDLTYSTHLSLLSTSQNFMYIHMCINQHKIIIWKNDFIACVFHITIFPSMFLPHRVSSILHAGLNYIKFLHCFTFNDLEIITSIKELVTFLQSYCNHIIILHLSDNLFPE